MEPPEQTPLSESALRAEAELVRQGYNDLPAGMGTTFLATAALTWVVAGMHGYTHAWLWMAAMGALVVWRSTTIFLYRRAERDPADYKTWKRQFTAGAALTGLGWGYASWVFYPIMGDLELSLLILVIAGITAGATRSLGPILPACWSFQLFSLAPLIVRSLQTGVVAQTIMGVLAIFYTAFLIAMARSYHRSLGDSLRLGYESAALAEELKEKQRQTDVLNRGLSAEVAHRREVEAELRAAKDRAESANQAKSEFLATMSHEIRTPMNGILGMLDLLKTNTLTPGQREQVDTAANSAGLLLRILNDILDFSKIETGRLDFESIPFRPSVVADEILALMRPRAAAKSLELRFKSNEGAGLRVMGDPMRFRQVLLNLVGNAVKFSEHGDIGLEILGTEKAGKVRLDVRVRDHGIGMSEATRARLFEPFQQADSSMSRKYGGSGLGLAISQKLVQGMGGSIAAISTPGEGSLFEFTLSLPMARDRDTALPFSISNTLPTHFDARILVVEDDLINQRVVSLMLQRLGLQHQIVADGQSALNALQAGDWDLVLMDCQLPGIDGLETTRRARLMLGARELPIVALTANARAEDRAACLAAGMDDFLAKPVRTEVLQSCLARWLHPAP